MAFAPDYQTSRLFYVAFTNPTGDVEIDEIARLNRFQAEPSSRRRVIVIPHREAGNHNGGQLQFGRDGYLYISVGDGGANAARGRPARICTHCWARCCASIRNKPARGATQSRRQSLRADQQPPRDLRLRITQPVAFHVRGHAHHHRRCRTRSAGGDQLSRPYQAPKASTSAGRNMKAIDCTTRICRAGIREISDAGLQSQRWTLRGDRWLSHARSGHRGATRTISLRRLCDDGIMSMVPDVAAQEATDLRFTASSRRLLAASAKARGTRSTSRRPPGRLHAS